MPFGFRAEELATIQDVLKGFPGVAEAVIFGSRAMGTQKNGSDVDIALKGTIDDRLVTRVSATLNEETPLPYFFDVVDYHTIANSALKDHIDRYGQSFYISTASNPAHTAR